jgi:hypothetical protein
LVIWAHWTAWQVIRCQKDETHLVTYVCSVHSVVYSTLSTTYYYLRQMLMPYYTKKKAAVNLQNYTKEYIPNNSFSHIYILSATLSSQHVYMEWTTVYSSQILSPQLHTSVLRSFGQYKLYLFWALLMYKGHCSMEHSHTHDLAIHAPKFLNTARETKCSVQWRLKQFHEHKHSILSGRKSMWSGFRKSSDKAAWIWHYEQNTYQVILQFWYQSIRNYSAKFNKSGTRVSEIYTRSSKWI